MYHVVAFVDARARDGLGHRLRCQTLLCEVARQARVARISLCLLCDDDTRLAHVLPEKIELVCLHSQERIAHYLSGVNHPDLFLIDSYALEADFYALLRECFRTVPILAIDDFGEKIGYPVTGYISFGLAAKPERFPSAAHKYSAIGAKYFPLRDGFAAKSPDETATQPGRVLVTMGGSDPEGQTLRIARVLRNLDAVRWIDILLGPEYGDSAVLEREIAGDCRFKLHSNLPHPGAIMSHASLAVTGGGVTCMELMSLGVPVAVLALADNQLPTCMALKTLGVGHCLGRFDRVTDAKLLTELARLIGAPALLAKMAGKAARLVDGGGGKRLGEFILGFLDAYHADKYSQAEVADEYDESAAAADEYAKVKWGSASGMQNRFAIALHRLRWQRVSSWLDIGSGTGAFLRRAESVHRIDSFVGVDLSWPLIQYALAQTYRTESVIFLQQNFMRPLAEAPFDLVTCIGVLQKSGVPLPKSLARIAELVRPGGQAFITTKNAAWKKFREPGFDPYNGHHWFEPEDLLYAIKWAGLQLTEMRGFDPRSGETSDSTNDYQSLYIIATRS